MVLLMLIWLSSRPTWFPTQGSTSLSLPMLQLFPQRRLTTNSFLSRRSRTPASSLPTRFAVWTNNSTACVLLGGGGGVAWTTDSAIIVYPKHPLISWIHDNKKVSDNINMIHFCADGEVRSQAWQVHGLLHVVPWRRGPQGCQRCYRHHQDKENHPVCWLVSHWIQGWNQLPAPNSSAWRWLG